MKMMVCTGPVAYSGQDAVQTDIANLRGRPRRASTVRSRRSCPSTSPSGFGRNDYYASEQEYLAAVAEAMREEYLAIVDTGLPAAGGRPVADRDADRGRPQRPGRAPRRAQEHVEALNHALRGIPRGPDPPAHLLRPQPRPAAARRPAADVVPVMLQINAGAYSFEVANPRHQHEWRIWADVPLPEGKVLMPGLLCHANNFVEHPELIADGIVPYASLVGRENVIASADCGFSSRAIFTPEVHPTVVWAKFAALAEGARHRHQTPLALTSSAVTCRFMDQQRRMRAHRDDAGRAGRLPRHPADLPGGHGRSAGGPHASTLWFVWHGTSMWLNSLGRSKRWTDLRRDPQVAAVVDTGEEFDELRGVELRGRVEFVGEVPRTGSPWPNWTCRNGLFHQANSHIARWARTGHGPMSDLSSLSGEERKSNFGAVRSVDDPGRPKSEIR